MNLKANLYKLLFVTMWLFCFQVSKAQRHVDPAISVIEPKTGDSVNSPQTYTTTYSIKNLGPDSIRSTDYYKLRILYGNVPFSLYTNTFKKDLGVNDSILGSINLKMNFDATNWNVPFCITLKEFNSVGKKDTLIKQTKQQLPNDTSCRYVTHISHLDIEDLVTKDKSYSIFPNPSEGDFKIILNSPASGNVVLYNFIGQIMYESEFSEKGDLYIKLPENLVGVFSLRLKINEQYYSQTIQIQQ